MHINVHELVEWWEERNKEKGEKTVGPGLAHIKDVEIS